MSGPIVRKYGFANFEKIFGERPLQHGVEDSETKPEDSPPAGAAAPVKQAKKPKPSSKPQSKKSK